MKKGDAIHPIHEQRTIYVRKKDGRRRRIVCDRGIVPLVRDLWENGFETLFSCEGDDRNYPYVVVSNYLDGPELADRIMRKFWKCDFFCEKTMNGHAFYALASEQLAKRRMEDIDEMKRLPFRLSAVFRNLKSTKNLQF